jgi:hypothetical protein
MKIALCLAIGCLTACAAGEPVGPVSGPAPAGALECALTFATQRGYSPVAGGLDSGFLRLGTAYNSDVLVVTYSAGVLRAVGHGGREPQRDIRALLAACGSTAT